MTIILMTLPLTAVCCEKSSLRIVGRSLAPRLPDGAMVTAEMGKDCSFLPARGEIVLFKSGASRVPLAKEVVGLPGERLSISKEGFVFVQGVLARNTSGFPYRLSPHRATMLEIYMDSYNGVIPSDSYLLLGEPSGGSLDSSRLGLIHRDDIMGRVLQK